LFISKVTSRQENEPLERYDGHRDDSLSAWVRRYIELAVVRARSPAFVLTKILIRTAWLPAATDDACVFWWCGRFGSTAVHGDPRRSASEAVKGLWIR
jgi:hypothetical protein